MRDNFQPDDFATSLIFAMCCNVTASALVSDVSSAERGSSSIEHSAGCPWRPPARALPPTGCLWWWKHERGPGRRGGGASWCAGGANQCHASVIDGAEQYGYSRPPQPPAAMTSIAPKMLSSEPLIAPTAELRDCTLGHSTEVGARDPPARGGAWRLRLCGQRLRRGLHEHREVLLDCGDDPDQSGQSSDASRQPGAFTIGPAPIFQVKPTRRIFSPGAAAIGSSSATTCGLDTAPSCYRGGPLATARWLRRPPWSPRT